MTGHPDRWCDCDMQRRLVFLLQLLRDYGECLSGGVEGMGFVGYEVYSDNCEEGKLQKRESINSEYGNRVIVQGKGMVV